MRGYDRDDYGQSGDKYEDYEDDEDGEDYDEEKEDPKPTKEALAYLELRQRLKEQLRKKKSGSSLANSSNKKELPYDNFGSFFGPSQPVVAERVIQEGKLFLETKHLTSSATNYVHHNKKGSGSTSAGSKSVSNFEFEDKVINLFKDFMARLGNFDELVATGSTLLVDFQQGLEFLRRPQIDETSDLVKNVIRGNETKRVKSYVEAGCLNADDGRRNISKLHTCQLGLCDHVSKGKNVLNELECLLEDINGAMRTAMGNLPDFQDDSFADRLNEKACNGDKEEFTSSHPKRNEVTDYAVVMGVIYSMVKQDYMMQERIVSAVNLKSSSGELESYCLMWSLRPFINNEIMDYAWKLIP
ncbi:uncharacterized protein LOC103941649 isoform X2 [Pyrus x bretschneideri]|uniref:uncharacterized protein LOC103941649 isoform X2 n=1 Tax=Pyrus x bretschneideri TaxID=225117 RepID=UPI00202FFFBB|nr:uncharacterized protein LOC103941649 isoform X2 [Pyrus x bretschneideri]